MKRENIIWGIVLILLGAGFLIFQLYPDRFAGANWPWILVALGGVFFVLSLLTRTGGTMVPGAVLLGLGGIFLYQTRTGNWASWSYIWTLIPGFVGAGLLLGSLVDPQLRTARSGGLITLVISLILFAIFGGLFGLSPSVLRYWPVLLIIAGAVIFVRSLRPRRE